MKTFKELYDEILASDELKKEFIECATNEKDAAAFLEKYDCGATVEELNEFMKERLAECKAAVNEKELEAVAGGTERSRLGTYGETALSFAILFGCIVYSVVEYQTTDLQRQCMWQSGNLN